MRRPWWAEAGLILLLAGPTLAASAGTKPPTNPESGPRGAPVRVEKTAKAKAKPQEQQRKRVVVVDAGHGGKDTGAIGPNGHQEKDIVLAIARQLHGMLRAERDLQSVMVRQDDRFVSLRQRLAVAQAVAADLFVSLHADADASGRVRGMSVYTLSGRGGVGKAIGGSASAGNASGGRRGKTGDRPPLLDSFREKTLRESGRAASALLHEIKKFFPLHNPQVQRARFMVLKTRDVPSILIETGFITHPTGEKDLSDPRRQKKIARTLFYGIRRFLTGVPRSKSSG